MEHSIIVMGIDILDLEQSRFCNLGVKWDSASMPHSFRTEALGTIILINCQFLAFYTGLDDGASNVQKD